MGTANYLALPRPQLVSPIRLNKIVPVNSLIGTWLLNCYIILLFIRTALKLYVEVSLKRLPSLLSNSTTSSTLGIRSSGR